MIGIIVNVLAVMSGGILGAVFGGLMSKQFTEQMNKVFGVSAICMGITSIPGMQNMPAVVISVVLGAVIGLACNLSKLISKLGELLNRPVNIIFHKDVSVSDENAEHKAMMITAIVLFCAGSTGIYGCLIAGMTGDSTILISKSVLDFFTAMVFACSLGVVVALVAVPQSAVFLALFWAAKLILPLTTPCMINDFRACGGFLMIATGLRVAKIKDMPVADMLPALILVMPMSFIWSNFIA